jgi:hypothetical protein
MRYLIFAGTAYYAAGGARDLISGVEFEPHAREIAENIIGMTGELGGEDGGTVDIEWSHILDLETKIIIAKFGDRPYGRSWDEDMVKTLTL